MPKYECSLNCEYVMGHLRYGHYEGVVEANSAEEAREMVLEYPWILDFVRDDYSCEDAPIDKSSLNVREVK